MKSEEKERIRDLGNKAEKQVQRENQEEKLK
jgi:hypothetical protein